ncbi:glycosyltransferase [Thermodesulfovibrionales bacterium]|nr:glycosyltransferase [Thermodesulfovibrionales bacterium]
MKILHIAISLAPEWGGPTKVVAGLTETLAKKGVEVALFAPVEKGDEAKIIRPKGVNSRLFEQGFFAQWWPGYSSGLAKAVAQEVEQFDIVHIHELWSYPHFMACRAARRAKKPYIVTIYGGLEPWAINHKAFKKRIYSALIQRRILQKAVALQAMTDEEVKHIRAFGVDTRIVVIPNGIDPEEFQQFPSREDLKGLYPELKGKKVVLFLSRIHPIKGLDLFAKAFGKVVERRDDIRLLIAGPDNDGYQAQVKKMLEIESALDKVIFTGMLTGREKLAALGGADLFVLPSYSEGFSMAILEAMICGLPVIITHSCNFPEVAEAEAGIVIDSDPEQLAEALTRLIDNPQLREEMGDNGRRLIKERFTCDKIADQMIQLYQDVLRLRVNESRVKESGVKESRVEESESRESKHSRES